MSKRFESKVVLVTGGTTGMGLAVAERIVDEGGAVVVSARRKELGDQVVADLRARGGQALFVAGDMTVESDVQAVVEAATREFGALHGAFNNAGGMNGFGPVQDIDTAAWDADISVGLTSVFYGLKYQIPALIAAGGGAVVNNASNLGLVGLGTVAPYVAAKHGVVGLTRATALENAQQGVRINAVCTGAVETPLFGATTGATPEGRDMVKGLHPLGRIAQPAEIASFVTYLLSEEASFITGAALAIDGGFTAQ